MPAPLPLVAPILGLALAAAAGGSMPAVLLLDGGPGRAFGTAAEALAAARPGDTVRLGDGVHQGPLVLGVPGVRLLGSRSAVVDGRRRGTTITVAADSVTLAGFTVRNSGRQMDKDDAAVKLVR
jgi:nitrous oxidase accessory protein